MREQKRLIYVIYPEKVVTAFHEGFSPVCVICMVFEFWFQTSQVTLLLQCGLTLDKCGISRWFLIKLVEWGKEIVYCVYNCYLLLIM